MAFVERHVRVTMKFASMIQAMTATQCTVEPIALACASLAHHRPAEALPRFLVRARIKSVSTTPMMTATRKKEAPIALVSAFLVHVQPVLRAAALQDVNARAKTRSASTIQVMTATPRTAALIALVSVSAGPAPLLSSPFAPRRNLHPAADSLAKNAPGRTRSVLMIRETVAIRRMAGLIAQKSAWVLHVEGLRV